MPMQALLLTTSTVLDPDYHFRSSGRKYTIEYTITLTSNIFAVRSTCPTNVQILATPLVYRLCQMLHDLRLTIYNDLCCVTGSNNEQSIDAKCNSAVVN